MQDRRDESMPRLCAYPPGVSVAAFKIHPRNRQLYHFSDGERTGRLRPGKIPQGLADPFL